MSENMTPFRVEWTLMTPLVAPQLDIHLDDLLAWGAVDEMQEQKDPEALTAKDELPLDRFNTEMDWVWKASRLTIEPASELMMIPWIRRTDVAQFAADKDKVFSARIDIINMGSGQLKAFADCFQAQWVKKIVAYGVGDIERVQELLNRMTHLGKWRRNGWGKIGSCVVTEDPMALTLWANRVVPFDAPDDLLPNAVMETVTHSLHPPYWDRSNMVKAKEPLVC